MTISFEIPPNIENQLRAAGLDLPNAAREAFLVDLYRKRTITHHELALALGVGRYETDGVLKRHGVPIEISMEELQAKTSFLESLREEGSSSTLTPPHRDA
jgi:hypothetical protein